MKIYVLLGAMLWCAPLYAQTEVVEVAPPAIAATPGIGTSPDIMPTLEALVDGDVDASALPEHAREIAVALEDLRAQRTSKLMLWAAMLAAIFKLLLSAVKLTGDIDGFWRGRQGKTVLRMTTLGLGGLVYLTSTLAMGVVWWEALILAASGPASMIIHEYSVLIPGLKKSS